MEDSVTAVIAEVFIMLSFLLTMFFKMLKTKRDCPSVFYCDSLIVGAHAVTSQFSIFPYFKKKHFSCSSITLCNGVNTKLTGI